MDNKVNHEKGCLMGSRDPGTGEIYFPPRPYAADGSLRLTEPVELSKQGILYSWTALGKAHFGQVDLPEGVRIQCPITPGDQEIDATYVLEITGEGDDAWRFGRA